jgi:acyl phosphate:glycerol-3-phosphate acyltransferase
MLDMPLVFFPLLVGAYLAGSINFSILLFRICGKKDPRSGGSGNPGATNVFRQAGPLWALAILILDVGRGALAAWISAALLPMPLVAWVGLALILGNCYPCFHRFRGGKGVANFLGFSIVLAPYWTFAGLAVYGLGIRLSRHPFIGSLLLVTLLGVGIFIAKAPGMSGLIALCFTIGLIFYAHKSNFSQVLNKKA